MPSTPNTSEPLRPLSAGHPAYQFDRIVYATTEEMFASAGFLEVRVERVQRKDTIGSFDEYWNPIETGVGSQPQLYVALPETDRREEREEVKLRLSPFLSDGHLIMSIEMLIGVAQV